MTEEKIEEKVSTEECCGGGPKVEQELEQEVSGDGQPVFENTPDELDEE